MQVTKDIQITRITKATKNIPIISEIIQQPIKNHIILLEQTKDSSIKAKTFQQKHN